MSEPEDLILEGAHFATRVARDVWTPLWRAPASRGRPVGERAYAARVVRHRALSDDRSRSRPWSLRRRAPGSPGLQPAIPRSRARIRSLSGTDGRRVYLPPRWSRTAAKVRSSRPARSDARRDRGARSRSTACWPCSRRPGSSAARRSRPRGFTGATRATGSCSPKRRSSIAGLPCKPRVWQRR